MILDRSSCIRCVSSRIVFSFVSLITTQCVTLLAHLVKGHVSFCHHLASVVCFLFTFESSPLKQLGQMIRHLVGIIYRRSSMKTVHFVPIG